MYIFLNKRKWYLLGVKNLEFEIKVDFSNEYFLGLLEVASGDDVLFGQGEDDVVRRVQTFGKIALNDDGFLQSLDGEGRRDGGKCRVVVVFNIHLELACF